MTVTPDQVAAKLAPMIRLHSQDPHQPSSVDWFINRCQIVQGQGHLTSGAADLPAGMSVVNAGPLSYANLTAASSSTSFGGGRNENMSLLPMTAPPAQPPVASWGWVTLLRGYFTNIGVMLPQDPGQVPLCDPHFYNYQLETFLGQNATAGTRSQVPIYCRIAARYDYYLISYFAFFPYNGGMGVGSSFTSRPLDFGCGFEAHISDWTRITAKVKITNDLVSLLYIDYEAHGDPDIVTTSNFTNVPLDQVPRITAYAAWHSHETYATAGMHLRPSVGFAANDYTDDMGAIWDTAANLTFVTDDGPEWVHYNGLWGAYITVPGLVADYLGNGPAGPSFQWYWTSETKDGQSPITQWKPTSAPPLPAPAAPTWSPPVGTDVYPGTSLGVTWPAVPGASTYLFTVSGSAGGTIEVTGTNQQYTVRGADMYHSLTAYVVALAPGVPPSPSAQSVQFYCGNSTG